MMRLVVLFILTASATLCGCASKPATQPAPDPSIQALNARAGKIADSMREMATLWQYNAARPSYQREPTSGPLATPIALNWDGPANKAVEAVAQLIGFHVVKIGAPPPTPVSVSIQAKGKSAFRVLRDIGWQAGERVGITLEPDQKTIVITYRRP